jgi:hypothetical protein
VLLSSRDLAAAPRWSDDRTGGLAGRCRGDLLGPWGDNLRRRFGDDAVSRVRARLPADLREVTAAPTRADWLPVRAQVRITEAIIDEFLAGDASALYPLVVEDTRRHTGRVALAALRALGPRRLLAMAPRAHHKVYDVGTVTADATGNRARIDFTDTPLFGHPTWRLLQLYATAVLLELQKARAEIHGEPTGPDRFAVHVRW